MISGAVKRLIPIGTVEVLAGHQPPQIAPQLPILTNLTSDDLSSERNVDYTKLRDFLKAGQWKQADGETRSVMLKVTGREERGWLDDESMKNFPCTDLRTIDQLWVKYELGALWLSVQNKSTLQVRGTLSAKY
ncbi:GUN4 domain-containing protein [Tolypothrix bouteillei VB521301_2]